MRTVAARSVSTSKDAPMADDATAVRLRKLFFESPEVAAIEVLRAAQPMTAAGCCIEHQGTHLQIHIDANEHIFLNLQAESGVAFMHVEADMPWGKVLRLGLAMCHLLSGDAPEIACELSVFSSVRIPVRTRTEQEN